MDQDIISLIIGLVAMGILAVYVVITTKGSYISLREKEEKERIERAKITEPVLKFLEELMSKLQEQNDMDSIELIYKEICDVKYDLHILTLADNALFSSEMVYISDTLVPPSARWEDYKIIKRLDFKGSVETWLWLHNKKNPDKKELTLV